MGNSTTASIADLFPDTKMSLLLTPTSLSCFQAREKFVYKTNLALVFSSLGKIRLQNGLALLFSSSGKKYLQNIFFLLYFLEAKVFNVIP